MLATQFGRNPDPCGTYHAEHLRHYKIAERKLFAEAGLFLYWGGGHGATMMPQEKTFCRRFAQMNADFIGASQCCAPAYGVWKESFLSLPGIYSSSRRSGTGILE
jgi:hypothetical protein